MSAYVSHYVAKYDRGTVTSFVAKLYGDKEEPVLDMFYTTDSVGCVVSWLKEECDKRTGVPPRLQVASLAPLIAGWIARNPLPTRRVGLLESLYYTKLRPKLGGGLLAAVRETSRRLDHSNLPRPRTPSQSPTSLTEPELKPLSATSRHPSPHPNPNPKSSRPLLSHTLTAGLSGRRLNVCRVPRLARCLRACHACESLPLTRLVTALL